jgi:hypothetical protein
MSDHRDSEPNDVLSFGPFSLFVAERLLKKGVSDGKLKGTC